MNGEPVTRDEPVDRWVELVCPVCDHDGPFDGQGNVRTPEGRAEVEWFYRHRCPTCGCRIDVPHRIDGEVVGTR